MNMLLALILNVAISADAEDAVKDLMRLQGTWNVIAAEREGDKVPGETLKKMQVVISDNTITIMDDKNNPTARRETATLELNPSTKPKPFDLKPSGTKGDNKPLRGIYELDNDSLKMCWAKEGGKRPTVFATRPKSNLVLLVLKRARKELRQ